MNLWEKTAKEMSKQLKHEYTTRDDVKSELYMLRCTPCEINDEFEYATRETMEAICTDNDCYACLDKYLDMEVSP